MRWVFKTSVFMLLAIAGTLAVRGLWGGAFQSEQARQIAALIEQLGHPSFAEREAAGDALEQIGKTALPALRQTAAKHADLEIQQRAVEVVRAIELSFGKSKTTGMELALIEPGGMEMGSPRMEAGRAEDETQHRVRISRSYLLGKFEVTQEEYHRVMKGNPSYFRAEAGGTAKVAGQDTARYPVEGVSWFDGIAFCNQLSASDGDEPYYEMSDIVRNDKGGSIKSAKVAIRGGSGYRLPTEAEWEYACRAGSTTPYSFGPGGGNGNNSNVKGLTYGGYGGNVVGPNLERTTKVGSYKANRWGLHDMHGNAAEWCWDWYGKDYYEKSPERDPDGPATGTHRVIRGGSWLVGEASSRSACRALLTPGEGIYVSGFRVARTP